MKAPLNRLLGWALLALSAFALIMSGVTTARWSAYAHCQAAVNDAVIASQQARADAAERDRQAIDDLVANVLAASEVRDPRASVAALRTYLAARADADRQRTEHPIPAPPSQTCG